MNYKEKRIISPGLAASRICQDLGMYEPKVPLMCLNYSTHHVFVHVRMQGSAQLKRVATECALCVCVCICVCVCMNMCVCVYVCVYV